jgi:hypothetical protein
VVEGESVEARRRADSLKPGYQGNPGHAGTGIVIAVLCGGE